MRRICSADLGHLAKNEPVLFHRYELAVEEFFAGIYRVGKLDRRRLDHRSVTARGFEYAGDGHFAQRQHACHLRKRLPLSAAAVSRSA